MSEPIKLDNRSPVMVQKMPDSQEIVSSQIITEKKHWWSRKRRKLIVMTKTAIYEVKS